MRYKKINMKKTNILNLIALKLTLFIVLSLLVVVFNLIWGIYYTIKLLLEFNFEYKSIISLIVSVIIFVGVKIFFDRITERIKHLESKDYLE